MIHKGVPPLYSAIKSRYLLNALDLDFDIGPTVLMMMIDDIATGLRNKL